MTNLHTNKTITVKGYYGAEKNQEEKHHKNKTLLYTSYPIGWIIYAKVDLQVGTEHLDKE